MVSGAVDAAPVDYTIPIAASIGGFLIVLIALCVWCHRKRRRRRRGLHRPLPAPTAAIPSSAGAGSSGRRPPSRQHVCDELGERFASVDSVWWRRKSFSHNSSTLPIQTFKSLSITCLCLSISVIYHQVYRRKIKYLNVVLMSTDTPFVELAFFCI